MKCALSLLVLFTLATAASAQSADRALEGRWNLTIQEADGAKPGWLEVSHSGPRVLVGRFTGPSGSARPISRVEFADGQMRFTIPPQWDLEAGDLTVTGRLDGDRLTGTMTTTSGRPATWTGVRAPALRRTTPPVWGDPVNLIGSTGIAGWHVIGGANQWEVSQGVLRNRTSGGNLVTDRKFEDFKLHAEFRYPEGSNSGIYLRGRYEVQITDSEPGEQGYGVLGAVYGYLPPTSLPARRAGEWQTFDITLVGRKVTIALNGETIISEQEIPGTTGGALDSDEAAPGPLLIQGDHGAIEFRNLTITPAR